jgi:phosphatidylglycerophosphate synthase
MLDIQLRPLKDKLFDSITPLVPLSCSPLHITFLAFLSGILACLHAAAGDILLSTTFWVLNRALDCLDGAVARKRNRTSDLGGFFDLLGDFIIYSAIPICCALALDKDTDCKNTWLSVAVLESTIHVNNFVLFYIGAILEKRKSSEKGNDGTKVKELTSIAMRPALVEGVESGALFTAMLVFPSYLQPLCWLMAFLVCLGIAQRTKWLKDALR